LVLELQDPKNKKRNMNMKKLIYPTLILAVAAFAVGCKGKKEAKPAGEKSAAKPKKSTAKKAKATA
jgi:PBP1b-binding outer membrane lipoprotein LpoB